VDDREQRARAEVRRAKKNFPWFSKDGILRWLQFEPNHPAALRLLVAAARSGDAEAIELLREYDRNVRRAGMQVSGALREFIRDYFDDGSPPANRAWKSVRDTKLRNVMIGFLVWAIADKYGFPVYQNAEYRDTNGPMTACRIVGEELELRPRTVEEIYGKWKEALNKEEMYRKWKAALNKEFLRQNNVP
jgi:hypothetical protein